MGIKIKMSHIATRKSNQINSNTILNLSSKRAAFSDFFFYLKKKNLQTILSSNLSGLIFCGGGGIDKKQKFIPNWEFYKD